MFSDIFKCNGKEQAVKKERISPVLFEPRLSKAEPEHILEKKLEPTKRNGKIEELPSFETFRRFEQGLISPIKRKLKTHRTGLKIRRKIPKITHHPCGCPSKSVLYYLYYNSNCLLQETILGFVAVTYQQIWFGKRLRGSNSRVRGLVWV